MGPSAASMGPPAANSGPPADRAGGTVPLLDRRRYWIVAVRVTVVRRFGVGSA